MPDDDTPAAFIADLDDWRGALLSRGRELILEAVPDVAEDMKWRKPSNPRGVPAWSHEGLLCTGEIYKAKVKFTFAKGASLDDPTGVFNASLDAGTRRAVDLVEGDEIPAEAFRDLIRAAAALNAAR